MKAKKVYIDQYGNNYYAHTLKELKSQIGGRVSLMFRDDGKGNIYKVGYVIGNLWLACYEPSMKKV